jgi:lipopolysaccharide/colanic/teichoic acid biosynthesis glycosyltransferase
VADRSWKRHRKQATSGLRLAAPHAATTWRSEPSRRVLRSPLAKRALDLAIAVPALALLTVPFLAVWAAIRATSAGPVLFRQERVGQGRQPFTLYKLRTMVVDGDDGAHRDLCRGQLLASGAEAATSDGAFKLEHDPRVTPLGAWLRRSSIDELPQLVNVLRGEMSIVGPRPALAWEVDLYRLEHLTRFSVRPGLTGLWQTSGRNRLSMLDMLELDCRYAREWSLALDLRIIARTPRALIRGDGAR